MKEETVSYIPWVTNLFRVTGRRDSFGGKKDFHFFMRIKDELKSGAWGAGDFESLYKKYDILSQWNLIKWYLDAFWRFPEKISKIYLWSFGE